MDGTDPMVKDKEAPLGDKRAPLGTGRLGVYTALGAATGSVPLPVLPDQLVRRLRGALVHDVSARHGLSLTAEARDVLSAPHPGDTPPTLIAQAMRYASSKLLARFTPLGFLSPVRSAAQTFALGHLLDRYIATARRERAVRIDREEARRVRRAIDHAVINTLRSDLHPAAAPSAAPIEDLRDQVTQILDGIVIAAAGIPDWMVRRLDAAFDEAIRRA